MKYIALAGSLLAAPVTAAVLPQSLVFAAIFAALGLLLLEAAHILHREERRIRAVVRAD